MKNFPTAPMDFLLQLWRDRGLQKLAETLGAELGYLNRNPEIQAALGEQVRHLEKYKKSGGSALGESRELIAFIYETSKTSDEAIRKMYDVEYGRRDSGVHYGYASAITTRAGARYLIGLPLEKLKNLKIIDIGAGSGEFLRFCRDELGCLPDNLWATDVSGEAASVAKRDGFHAAAGRIENLSASRNFFDLVFLSYFIDYDTNQEATFRGVVPLVRPGGQIILEGLLPCQPFGMLEKDKKSFRFVTRGKSAGDDVRRIVEAFQSIAKEAGRKISLLRVASGERFVYSRHGLNQLPSYFLVMRVDSAAEGV